MADSRATLVSDHLGGIAGNRQFVVGSDRIEKWSRCGIAGSREGMGRISGGTDTQPARAVGVDFATANDSGGQPIPLATNYDVGGGVNENDTNDDGLIFGAVDVSDLTDIVFDAGEAPSCTVASQDVFGVRAQSNIPVNSIFSNLLGLPLGPYSIEAKSDAIYDCNIGSPRLVHINQFLPGP